MCRVLTWRELTWRVVRRVVQATVDGLEQGYCVVPPENRFRLLFTFLKRNKDKKVGPTEEARVCFFISALKIKIK